MYSSSNYGGRVQRDVSSYYESYDLYTVYTTSGQQECFTSNYRCGRREGSILR